MEVLLKLLGPFAPFLTHELWERIGGKGMLCTQPWPLQGSESHASQTEIVIQVDGRLRDRMSVQRDTAEDQVVAGAMQREAVIRHVGTAAIARIVFVPNRILNIVTKGGG
jgi:leucyl-tRNA synthetase